MIREIGRNLAALLSPVTDHDEPRGNEPMAETEAPADRLVIRFDPKTLTIWPGDAKRKAKNNRLKGAVVTEFVERPTQTPTGGRYTSQRFTVRYQGKKWYGTVKNGTDVVRLRLADEE